MAAEDRIHDLERDITTRSERLDEVEAQLRQHQMSDALREIREPAREGEAPAGEGVPLEDRRSSTPFVQELAVDAKRSLMRIMGITQVLKHKKDAKEHGQLVKQLAALARRLDHTVGDLAEADELARGTIELAAKRINLEALIERVVDESGVKDDHDVRLETSSFSITVDPQRTEQIVGTLIRNAGERTPGGKGITVRLSHQDGGALMSVEDPEPSSDASLSPVVSRFAEVLGGWAKVEDREKGGSAFKVFLPDAAPPGEQDAVQIVVEEPGGAWEPSNAQILVQELHRLAEKD
jgi:signal transduction histidine kinase